MSTKVKFIIGIFGVAYLLLALPKAADAASNVCRAICSVPSGIHKVEVRISVGVPPSIYNSCRAGDVAWKKCISWGGTYLGEATTCYFTNGRAMEVAGAKCQFNTTNVPLFCPGFFQRDAINGLRYRCQQLDGVLVNGSLQCHETTGNISLGVDSCLN